LQEVDPLCGFSRELRPLSGYEPRVGNLYQTLLGALIRIFFFDFRAKAHQYWIRSIFSFHM
jgi:hypothetical protein